MKVWVYPGRQIFQVIQSLLGKGEAEPRAIETNRLIVVNPVSKPTNSVQGIEEVSSIGRPWLVWENQDGNPSEQPKMAGFEQANPKPKGLLRQYCRIGDGATFAGKLAFGASHLTPQFKSRAQARIYHEPALFYQYPVMSPEMATQLRIQLVPQADFKGTQ